ncbi:aryl-sulfate sulfotransferase [Myxococcota bacterium]|nr:aryl-sulfate sulfotransferase [Myxococcota bacterium]
MPGLLLLVLACGDKDGGVEIGAAEVTLSETIGTVATVTFTTSEDVAARVVYETADQSFETPLGPATADHEIVLLGLPANTEVQYQVVLEDGTTNEPAGFTTGNLPSGLPATLVEGEGHDRWMMTTLIGATTGPVLISPQGKITWAWVDGRGLDVYRARPLRDGSGVIYNAASVSGDPADNSVLVKVSWDGSAEETITVPLLAHDFVELSDGTITAIVVEYGEGPEGEIRGDSLVEIAPDGTQTQVWSTWDCFDPAVTPGDEPEIGWTFVNALDLDPDESAYYVSVRNFSSIVKIDRATGACEWVIGGQAATIEIEGDEFQHEHQFELNGDRLLVFDNAGLAFNKSRAIEYQVDWGAGVATEIWKYEPDPSLNSFVLGDVARLDDGDTFITWSVAGQLDRVSPDGVSSWRLNTELGYAFGFMTLPAGLYE